MQNLFFNIFKFFLILLYFNINVALSEEVSDISKHTEENSTHSKSDSNITLLENYKIEKAAISYAPQVKLFKPMAKITKSKTYFDSIIENDKIYFKPKKTINYLVKKYSLSQYNLLGFYDNLFFVDNEKLINSKVNLNFKSDNNNLDLNFLFNINQILPSDFKLFKKFDIDKFLYLRGISYLIKRELNIIDEKNYYRRVGDHVQFSKRLSENLNNFNTLKITFDDYIYDIIRNNETDFNFFLKFSFNENENSNGIFNVFENLRINSKVNVSNFSGRLNYATPKLFETFFEDEEKSIFINLNPYYQKIDKNYNVYLEEIAVNFHKFLFDEFKLPINQSTIKKITLIENKQCRFNRENDFINYCFFSEFNSDRYVNYQDNNLFTLNLNKVEGFFDHNKVFINIINQGKQKDENGDFITNIYLDNISIKNYSFNQDYIYFSKFKKKYLPIFLVEKISDYYNYNTNRLLNNKDYFNSLISESDEDDDFNKKFEIYYNKIINKVVDLYNSEFSGNNIILLESSDDNLDQYSRILDFSFNNLIELLENEPFIYEAEIDFFDGKNKPESTLQFLEQLYDEYSKKNFTLTNGYTFENVNINIPNLDTIYKQKLNQFTKIKVNEDIFQSSYSVFDTTNYGYILESNNSNLIIFTFLLIIIIFINYFIFLLSNNNLIDNFNIIHLNLKNIFLLLTLFEIIHIYFYSRSDFLSYFIIGTIIFSIIVKIFYILNISDLKFLNLNKKIIYNILSLIILLSVTTYTIFQLNYHNYIYMKSTDFFFYISSNLVLIFGILVGYYIYFTNKLFYQPYILILIFLIILINKIYFIYIYFEYVLFAFFDLICFSLFLDIYIIFNLIFLRILKMNNNSFFVSLFSLIIILSISGNLLKYYTKINYFDSFNVLCFTLLIFICSRQLFFKNET